MQALHRTRRNFNAVSFLVVIDGYSTCSCSCFTTITATLHDSVLCCCVIFDVQLWNSPGVEQIPLYTPIGEPTNTRDGVGLACSPRPTVFTPCEDLFEELWLRIAAWMVALLALSGNITVILVIVFGKAKMDNTRFLVLNLAIADLCLGIYLLILCILDVATRGEFSVVALDWQYSVGAKVAGFLAVFSTEMSFYTLMLITVERYVTIHYSYDLRTRFTPRRLKIFAVIGWILAFFLAIFPALEVLSSYTKYVLALPFDISEIHDKAYVGFLLIFNGLSIVVISACYLKIYLEIRNSPAFNKKDYQVGCIADRIFLAGYSKHLHGCMLAFFHSSPSNILDAALCWGQLL